MDGFSGKPMAPGGGGRFAKGKEDLERRAQGAPPANPQAKANQVHAMLSQSLTGEGMGASPDFGGVGKAAPGAAVEHYHPELSMSHSHPAGDQPHRHG